MFRSPETPGVHVAAQDDRPDVPLQSSFVEKASVAGFSIALPVSIMEICYVLNETSLETGDIIAYGFSLTSLAISSLGAYKYVRA